jgi:hypothetical protein
MEKTEKKKSKKPYQKPALKTEKVLEAGLGATCNGSSVGGRKSAGPCTIIKS